MCTKKHATCVHSLVCYTCTVACMPLICAPFYLHAACLHVKYTCACCYFVTCMSNTHVHVATMPHACQVRMCMWLLCHMHVKYARAFWCLLHACQIHMWILLLCHMHIKHLCACCYCAMCMLIYPRYHDVIDPYQISFTLMLFIPTQTQCMYHRVSYISTVLDSLLITFHKGNSIRLSCVRSHFLTHSSSTTMAEYQHLPGRHAAHVPHLPDIYQADMQHMYHLYQTSTRQRYSTYTTSTRQTCSTCNTSTRQRCSTCNTSTRQKCSTCTTSTRQTCRNIPHLPGRHAEIYHSACVPHTQKLKCAIVWQSSNMHTST